MNRHDLHAEREWIAQMSERNERARRIAAMRRARIPRDDGSERTLVLMVVILAALPFVVGLIVWGVMRWT